MVLSMACNSDRIDRIETQLNDLRADKGSDLRASALDVRVGALERARAASTSVASWWCNGSTCFRYPDTCERYRALATGRKPTECARTRIAWCFDNPMEAATGWLGVVGVDLCYQTLDLCSNAAEGTRTRRRVSVACVGVE